MENGSAKLNGKPKQAKAFFVCVCVVLFVLCVVYLGNLNGSSRTRTNWKLILWLSKWRKKQITAFSYKHNECATRRSTT